MDKNKLLEYSMQLAMLVSLHDAKLITDNEYKRIKKTLVFKYHIKPEYL